MKLAHVLSVTSALSSFCWMTGAQAADPPFTIELGDVRGTGCEEPEFVTVEQNELGHYYIEARFYEQGDGFLVETDATHTTARKHCTIPYRLLLKPGYVLESADFVVDGEYDLSEQGRASLSVRYNVPGIGKPSIAFDSFRYDTDPLAGAFLLEGNIDVEDDEINYCGAEVPLEIQVKGTARRGRKDKSDSLIAIDNGVGHSTVRCEVVVKPCDEPDPCGGGHCPDPCDDDNCDDPCDGDHCNDPCDDDKCD